MQVVGQWLLPQLLRGLPTEGRAVKRFGRRALGRPGLALEQLQQVLAEQCHPHSANQLLLEGELPGLVERCSGGRSALRVSAE